MSSQKVFFGVINPLRPNPCFAVPIFKDEQRFYTQVLEGGDTIKSFDEIIFSENVIIQLDSEIICSVGDLAVQAFDTGKGEIIFGDKESLALQLKPRINHFKDRPFLLEEIFDFLNYKTETNEVSNKFKKFFEIIKKKRYKEIFSKNNINQIPLPEYTPRANPVYRVNLENISIGSASISAVNSRAEALKVSRTFDWLILFTAFFVILGGYHIHYMLIGGDWDLWSDWKDRRLWVIVAPIVSISFPAAVQAVLWGRYRIAWGATVCVLGLLLGEWINRYFNFWGWAYFPVNICFPSNLVPGAIVLDVVLMMSGSYTLTAVVGGLGWGLIFYPGNWAIIAPLHIPIEYNGMMFTLADLQGYHYVRTGTPEYIRMVEKGTLKTFGKNVASYSAFISGFISIFIYLIWHVFGEWFGSTRFVESC